MGLTPSLAEMRKGDVAWKGGTEKQQAGGADWLARGRGACPARNRSPGSSGRPVASEIAAMATDELASKLQRRLDIEDEPADAEPEPSQAVTEEEKPPTAAADNELSAKLARRGELNVGSAEPQLRSLRVFNPNTEFKEFSRKQIRDMEGMFRRYDAGKDGFIDLMELKLMMEKLEAPQTHLGLKNMIKEVDEDFDGKLSFREFLLIFRKAAAGELAEDSGLHVLAHLSEIDVSTEGVKGAKTFFEAKLQVINDANKFEQEIKEEQEEKKKLAEEKKQKRAAFKELQSTFK